MLFFLWKSFLNWNLLEQDSSNATFILNIHIDVQLLLFKELNIDSLEIHQHSAQHFANSL